MALHLTETSESSYSDPMRATYKPEFSSTPELSTRPELSSRLTSESMMNAPKPSATNKNEQSFIPASMRALYYTYLSSDGTGERTGSVAANGNGMDENEPYHTSGRTVSIAIANVFPGLVLDMGFPTPVPSSNQYLLKIKTAAFCQDEVRLATALNPRKTTPQIPLHSICGTVINTPSQDHERPEGSRFKIGDDVFGVMSYTRDGGAADYALALESELALKPPNISAAEAAAVALPALTAWQALFKYGGLDPDAPANGHGVEQAGKKSVGGESGRGNGNGSKQHWWSGYGYGNGGHRFLGNGANFGSGHDGQHNGSRRGSHWWNGQQNGRRGSHWWNGNGLWRYGVGHGNGNGNGNGHHWWNRRSSKIGSQNGIGQEHGNGNGQSHEQGHENGTDQQKQNGEARRKSSAQKQSKAPQLRVLITNARDSEVGRIAVQLLRADKLFNHISRPWICVTCTGAEEDIVRRDWDVDEVLIIPHLPAQNECDLGRMFRRKRWGPVDLVLDCTGGEVFRQAHSATVVKEYGAVLTAVDPRPAQEPYNADEQDVLGRRKRGIRSRFVPVNPDAVALARIAEFIEDNEVRGREEQVVDLVNSTKLLEAGAAGAAGSRRGGMMVVRVN